MPETQSSVLLPRDSCLITLRPYQRAAFLNRTNGIEVWLWGRQTGKSYTLASWAVDRLLTRPGRLVTVLSNSKVNGMEFNHSVAKVCGEMGKAFEQADLSPDKRYENMNCETRIHVGGKVGRIKILAANPRTARGFSGDLILDEFAFHEDAEAIWNAAEPVLSSNQDFLCRIASTPNGKHNLFYRFCHGRFPVRRVTRTDAWLDGCPIFHPITREKIDPITARSLAENKRSYDQNYECAFEEQNMALLTHELINAAERPHVGVLCSGDWSSQALAILTAPPEGSPERKTFREWIKQAADPEAMYRNISMNCCNGSADRTEWLYHANFPFGLHETFLDLIPPVREDDRRLFAGVDVGRQQDRTVITIVERLGNLYIVRAILRLDQARFPLQQERIETILRLPTLRALKIDMTGVGLGLFDYLHEKFPDRIHGLHFASTIKPDYFKNHDFGGARVSVRVPEYLATQLLQIYEDRAIQQPIDSLLRDDLRKPERLVSPSGRVSIAATRDNTGHADHFWSLALALDAAQVPIQQPFYWHAFTPRARLRSTTL